MHKLRSLFFTDVDGSLPTAGANHRGMFALKRAASTADELHIAVLDDAGDPAWHRVVTDAEDVTFTGTVTISVDSGLAFVVRDAASGDRLLSLNTVGNTVNIINGGNLVGYSNDGATDTWAIYAGSGNAWFSGYVRIGTGTARIISAAGDPEGAVTAPVGSLYLRTNGSTGTTLYVKESGTGNTGWAAK
jgi:hypothetical protein